MNKKARTETRSQVFRGMHICQVPRLGDIKCWIRRNIVVCLDRLGIEHNFRSGDATHDIRRLVGRSPTWIRETVDQDGPPVLLFGARTLSGITPLFTGLVSHALRLRGARPHVVLCDEALPACESIAITDYRDWSEFSQETGRLPACSRCFLPTASIIEAFGLPYHRLGDLITAETLAEARRLSDGLSLEEIMSFNYEGVDLGEQVRTSLYRFLLVGTLEYSPSTLAVARRYLAAGIAVSTAVRQLIEGLRPICIVAHHGIYLVNGTACATARAMGVRVVVYDGAYRRNTVVISHGHTYHHELRSEPWLYWEDLTLSEQQNRRLDEYVRGRQQGSAPQDYITYHPNPISEHTRVRDEVGLAGDQKTIVLFTNVTWDGRVHAPDGIFAGPIEWVLTTLKHLENRSGIRVVVRVHPAEVKNKDWIAQQRMDEEIRRSFPVLPRNVVVVPPESDVNSYTLAELAHVVIVYSSKIGLEAALMGLPVIIAGDAFYGCKGIGIEPQSRDEYFAILDRVESLTRPLPQQVARVRQYAYHYYFRRVVELPSVFAQPFTKRIGNLADVMPGRQHGLDVIANGILYGTPFIDHQA